MKILYLNCFRQLKRNLNGQRDWLKKIVEGNEIDIVCLAESSNYDFGDLLSDMFPNNLRHRWNDNKSILGKSGWKFNICSKHPAIFEPINYPVPEILVGSKDLDVLTDYCTGKMVNISFDHVKYNLLPVHIQHKSGKSQNRTKGNAFYEEGLLKLRNHMIEHEPIVVFGDFNNYPEDKSFTDLTKDTGYHKANALTIPYTYRNNKEDPGVLIDHAFTNSDNVYMEFIPAIEQGFNHHGMFITIK